MALPNARNLVLCRSIFKRSLSKMRPAVRAAKGPGANVAHKARRRDRTLAAWAQSRRVALSRAYNDTTVAGAARGARLRKRARVYAEALATWRAYYNGAHAI